MMLQLVDEQVRFERFKPAAYFRAYFREFRFRFCTQFAELRF